MILEIDKKNCNEYLLGIANVHYSAYSKKHFTSCFNKLKLAEYYKNLINNSDLTLVFLDENNDISGFIVAGYTVGSGVADFIKSNRLYLMSVFSRNPSFFVEKVIAIVKSKLPSNQKAIYLEPFRLMSIAVDSQNHSKGIGGALISEFETLLKSRGIKGYGLSVRKENVRAIKFYLKNGFHIDKETNDSVYYGKDL